MGSATRTPIAWINLKTRRIDLVGAVHCVIAVVPNARAELGEPPLELAASCDPCGAAVERVRTETGYHVEKDPPNVMRSHGEKENGAHNVSCVEATVVAAALGGHGSDGEGDAGKEADDA